ncbi:sugar kinase [Aliivibrio sp. SR45-2]|uniref:sugar kinase n=1 Tax=Aliivibrio sp. SR45-2 TaxID=2760931 RepID=UPI0015F7A968|nr:sugar kinase [Aliivibrio sp. SR45-2]MBB1314207.1 sugar kinase [Aliivibrio sp. SR45-2]
MSHIAIIGECMIELNGSPFGDMHQSYGGDTLNAAIYLNRSLPSCLKEPYSVRISYITSVGTDAISQEMIKRWEDEGICTDLVLRDDKRSPGLYLIQLDDKGERTFLYWRNDSAARYLVQHPDFEKLSKELNKVDVIFVSGISLAILPDEDRYALLLLLNEWRQQGITIVFDSNYRSKLWDSELVTKEAYQRSYQTTDIALVTYDDEQLLWGDKNPKQTVTRLHALGVKTVVVKLGSEGCLVSEAAEQEPTLIATERVEIVVDTTSAGDSFNGGFLSCYLTGGSMIEACRQGNALAGLIIQHHGAIIPKAITDTLSIPT